MPLAGDIRCNLHTVSETDTGDFTNGGVRLSRRLGSHLRTHASLKWRRIKGGAILERIKTASKRRLTRLRRFIFAPPLGKLVYRCHLSI